MNKSVYQTKNNINGVSYKLIIDHDKKTIEKGTLLLDLGEKVSRRTLEQIAGDMIKAGYKVIND